jgi:hypothetical protein
MRRSSIGTLIIGTLSLASFGLALGCSGGGAKDAGDAAGTPKLNAIPRAAFNQIAADLDLPLFWAEDRNKNGAIDPDELSVLWGVADTREADWVTGGAFTPAFQRAYGDMVAYAKGSSTVEKPATEEARRRRAVLRELSQGRPTLVASDFRKSSEEDRAVVKHVLAAAAIVEKLYQRQTGTYGMAAQIPADDPASRMLFYRNQGPQCEAPATREDPDCSAIPGHPKPVLGLYPAKVQAQPNFCETLAKRPDGRALMDPFVVVASDENGALSAVPYQRAFENDMQAVSRELEAAAAAITNPDEASFQAYLSAAAKAFRDGRWFEADEAWARMSSYNSKWYLRVAPDEVYFEPCSRKAGFHVSFARIDPGSLAWKEKLDPIKGDMEKTIAELAGPPYTARSVAFKLPDFISIILNAGDSREPFGATIGQSLPNFGPVPNEGRGRTVAMVNFYTDPDSLEAARTQASSLLCGSAMASYTDEQGPQLMSTVLHEAAHNLGPAAQYKVDGKIDTEVFGGPLASTLEELKAQSAALFFEDWLVGRKVIKAEEAQKAHVHELTWSFGHISRGMYDQDKKPEPYSQLAAIQVGFLMDEGVIAWNAGEKAANGTDQGCFTVKLDAYPAATKKLMGVVAHIKGAGDRKAAEALVQKYVDAPGAFADVRKTITERWLRQPKATFVYSIRQ